MLQEPNQVDTYQIQRLRGGPGLQGSEKAKVVHLNEVEMFSLMDRAQTTAEVAIMLCLFGVNFQSNS